jgi:hypothetical protein
LNTHRDFHKAQGQIPARRCCNDDGVKIVYQSAKFDSAGRAFWLCCVKPIAS